jgi:hypothetical protein
VLSAPRRWASIPFLKPRQLRLKFLVIVVT